MLIENFGDCIHAKGDVVDIEKLSRKYEGYAGTKIYFVPQNGILFPKNRKYNCIEGLKSI